MSAIQEKIDGMNVWDTISLGKKSPRTVVRIFSLPLKSVDSFIFIVLME